MIGFATIPLDVRTPGQYLEIDASRATSGLPSQAQRILVIGQRLNAGTVAALAATRILSAPQATQAFGRGSMLAQQLAALKAANDPTECWAIALDDLQAGTAAQGTMTVTGSATASGTLALLIQGARVPVGVTAGDQPATVAAAIAAAIALQPDLIVTAVAAAGVVTLTARHKGTCGNDVDVRLNYFTGDATPAGLGVAIAAMTNGASNPDLAPVWAAIGDTRYATIVLPATDAATLASAEGELASRWGPMRPIDGMGYAAVQGPMGAQAALGASRNSAFVSILGLRGSPTASWQVAASYAGVVAFNGAIDPARPFTTLPLPGIMTPATADRWTRQEAELLLHDGISTASVASGVVAIQRAITTYQTSAYGIADVAFLDVNTPLTLSYIRYAVRARIAQKFPRMKLADDATAFGPGQPVVTPTIIRAELLALFRELEEAGIVEDIDQFKADLIVERDAADRNRVNALIPPNIVNQFRVFAGAVQFRL